MKITIPVRTISSNTFLLRVLCFTCLLTTATMCSKNIGCDEVKHQFGGTFTVLNDSDSVRVGDTIYLESRIPFYLHDLETSTVVRFKKANNISTSIGFLKHLGNNAVDAANDFDLEVFEGTFHPDVLTGDSTRHYSFALKDSVYHFKLRIIPKLPGDYSFSISDDPSAYPDYDECARVSFNFRYQNTDQHLYIYTQNRPGYTPSESEAEHLYFFRVY